MNILFITFFVITIASSIHAQTLKWGATGHSTIARIAVPLLNAKATAFVQYLLPNTDLPSIASWADDVRNQLPWSAPLHFIDTADWQCYYNPATDCPNTNGMKRVCVDGAIQNYTQQLSVYSSLPFEQAQEALKFVVHFVGDVHQPLHVSFSSDRGGNDERGMICDSTKESSLHSIWDTWIIQERINNDFGGSTDNFYNYLVNQLNNYYGKTNVTNWLECGANPTPYIYNACSAIWATESAKYACSNAYTNTDGTHITDGFSLGCDYYQENYPLIEMRLIQGGVRLANLLNSVSVVYNPSLKH